MDINDPLLQEKLNELGITSQDITEFLNNVSNDCMKFLKENEKTIFPDQIKLNMLIRGFNMDIYTIPMNFEEKLIEYLTKVGKNISSLEEKDFQQITSETGIPIFKYSLIYIVKNKDKTESEEAETAIQIIFDSGSYLDKDTEMEYLNNFKDFAEFFSTDFFERFNELLAKTTEEKNDN